MLEGSVFSTCLSTFIVVGILVMNILTGMRWYFIVVLIGIFVISIHEDVVTDLEPDILECEVKWALGSITTNKASGSDEIPAELFQILKDDAVNMPANLENLAVATGLGKVSFHSNPKERQCQRMLKLPHNCTHLTC